MSDMILLTPCRLECFGRSSHSGGTKRMLERGTWSPLMFLQLLIQPRGLGSASHPSCLLNQEGTHWSFHV